jgi:hypothetical protein
MTISRPSTRSTCWHEAEHAASLCLAGMTPLVARVDWPTETLAGAVTMDWERHDPTPDVLREVLVSVLLGPLSNGELVDRWDWPVNVDTSDGEQVRFLVNLLRLDQVGFLQIVFKAQRLGRDRTFRRLLVDISNALEHKEVLLQPELQAMTDAVLSESPKNA